MRAAERSIMVLGAYLAAVGVALAPAIYFVAAARASAVWFMRAVIAARCSFAAALVGFALAGLVTPPSVLFARPDLAGAAWSAAALRRSG